MNKQLSSLRRSAKALSRLRRDTEHMVPMEMYHGMGNVVVRTYTALHQTIKRLIDEPLIEVLSIDLPDDATDRQKVTQVNLLAGQLHAYTEDAYEDLKTQLETNTNEPIDEAEQTLRRFNQALDNE